MATKKAPHNATPGWTTEDVVATNDREPSIDEQLPPVYENGLNTGAHIEEALEVEELDMDLYRSKVG